MVPAAWRAPRSRQYTTTAAMRRPTFLPSLLLVTVTATGGSALVFESLWFRQAGLAFGNSVWATSLVLTAFMTGLALGSLVAGRWGDGVAGPLRAAAAIEVVLATTGASLVFALPALGPGLAVLLRPLADHPWLLNALRLLVAFVLLLVPSTAMGASLPLLTRALAETSGHYGHSLGRLYGWNTAGGVIGVIEGHLLVGVLGIRGTALAAAAVSVGAAGIMLWLAARLPVPVPLIPAQDQGGTSPTRPGRRTYLLSAFIAGFCLLALEVIWFRLLLLFVLGNAVAFAAMLAIVLAGVALGGLAAGSWLRRSDRAFRWSTDLASIMCIGVIAAYAAFPYVAASFTGRLIHDVAGVLRLGLPLMFPVSFGSGVLFTLLGAALRQHGAAPAHITGRLTMANTLGAALGSLAGGFVILPWLGIERGLMTVAALYGLIALTLGWQTRTRATVPLFLVAALTIPFFPSGVLEGRLIQTTARRLEAMRGESPARRHEEISIAAVREGLTETLVYVRVSELGRPLFYQLFTNAISMADTEYVSRRYMKLFAYWPLAVHAHIERALVICYGIGNTAKALTDSNQPQSIDIVDISRDVLDSNAIVFPGKTSPLADPRVRVHVEDGRYFLQSTEQRFDLITAEPPPPTAAGAVSLYTREYFELLRDRLSEGGIVAYWLPLHAMSDAATRSILRAFCDAFPDCSLWNGMGAQLMMIGRQGPSSPVSEDLFVRLWQDPTTAVELKRLGLERPEQLGALFIGDADFVNEITEGAPPLTDDWPRRIETAATDPAAATRLFTSLTDTTAARQRFARSAVIARWWPARMRVASEPYFEPQRLINAYAHGGTMSMGDVHQLLTTTPLATPVLWFLGSDWDVQQTLIDASSEQLRQPDFRWHLGIRLIGERSYLAAAEMFRRVESSPGHSARAFGFRVYALAMGGRVDAARQLVSARLTQAERGTPFWQWMTRTFGL